MSTYTKETYSEICEFLGLLGNKYVDKIPSKLLELFENNKSKKYVPHINSNIPIKEQRLSENTLAIIALLNLKYWCKDEDEKQMLKGIYRENEKKYQNLMREKYNLSNVFKAEEKIVINNEIPNNNMLIKFENVPFYKKMWLKIKQLFLHSLNKLK